MNLTRAFGVVLLVAGFAWVLAVPALLPAAYHGHVHTGHEHAQYAAHPVDPGAQSPALLVQASENAATVMGTRNWTAVRTDALSDAERRALDRARQGDANATRTGTRDLYRSLADAHPYVHGEATWFALSVTDTENYTVLRATATGPANVTRAIAPATGDLPSRAATQARQLASTDSVVLVSDPALPTPFLVEHGGQVHLVTRVGPAPEPPQFAAFLLFLVPGAVLVLLGTYLGLRG